MLFHVDIDYRADLAGGFVLVHGLGTVIGKTVIYTGAIVVGGIIVSENSIIKAGRVVSEDI